jgi:UDP-N-acetylglucosamine--N-acetylmuramyl-(pentapeptide) pyrophosphoryl-undecaprenol N-acetylglucosamine transferase
LDDHFEGPHFVKVVIACGGTGGHLFPGLAVAEELKSRGHDVLILISEKEIDAIASRGADHFEFRKLAAIAMPSPLSPAFVPFMFRMRESIRQCRRIYREFKPDAVLGMGGFTSMPPIIAGWRSKIPAFIHESNAFPGKANRLSARFAKSVFLGFEECGEYFAKRRIEVTGTPIRLSLRAPADKSAALDFFDFQPDRRTVLVMGGSQGARGLNQLVVRTLPLLRDWPVQFLHLTGREDERYVAENYTRSGLSAFVAPFFEHMERAYAVADCAIARSGASSLSELSYAGIPGVLIPYPHAADDHQTRNAEIYTRAAASMMQQERDATPESLSRKLNNLINEPEVRARMSTNMKRLSPDRAAQNIADSIEKLSSGA